MHKNRLDEYGMTIDYDDDDDYNRYQINDVMYNKKCPNQSFLKTLNN